MKLNEYLNNESVECSSELSKDNWDRIFRCKGSEIKKAISEGFVSIKVGSVNHMSVPQRKPEDLGVYDCIRRPNYYQYFSVEALKKFTPAEKRKLGQFAIGISTSILLPTYLWMTIYRCDVQERRKNKEIIELNGKRYQRI